MRASNLDKQIIIEKESTTTNAVGTPTEGYSFMKETWANVKFVNGSTEYSLSGALPFTSVEFTVRYDSNINYKCRVLYEGQYYEIGHLENIGRKHWIKIKCIVWEGESENGG